MLFEDESIKIPTEEKVKKTGLFDFVNDLSFDKRYILNEDNIKNFVPYMINRAFMQNPDTVLLANEANKAPGMTKEQLYDFYFYAVPKNKRRNKWGKSESYDEDRLKLLINYYNISKRTAIEYYAQLTQEELAVIERKCTVGGIQK